jgi:hypothetical protein
MAAVTDGIGLRVVAQRCIRMCGGDSQGQKDDQARVLYSGEGGKLTEAGLSTMQCTEFDCFDIMG